MIRTFTAAAIPEMIRIHEQSGLPVDCLPDLYINVQPEKVEMNALFVVNAVKEVDGKIAMMSFLKVRSEIYVLVDHNVGTPEERWEWLKEINAHMAEEARKKGLDQVTAFLPPELDKAFGKRLEEMGYVKGLWQSYSLNIDV